MFRKSRKKNSKALKKFRKKFWRYPGAQTNVRNNSKTILKRGKKLKKIQKNF